MSERPNPLLAGALGSYDGGVRVIPNDPADHDMADAMAHAYGFVRTRLMGVDEARQRFPARLPDFLNAPEGGSPLFDPEEVRRLIDDGMRNFVQGDATSSANVEAQQPLTLDVLDRAMRQLTTWPRQAGRTQATFERMGQMLNEQIRETRRLKRENADLRRQIEELWALAGYSKSDAPTLGGPLAAPTQEPNSQASDT